MGRETARNLKPGTICGRFVNYGKKDFLSPELQSKWNAFWDGIKHNSGNSEARFWTEEERADGHHFAYFDDGYSLGECDGF